MSLTFYLDKGASLGPDAPCLTAAGRTLSYGQVVALTHAVARALRRSGVRPGDKVGILSANDPVAFACVFGIARAGAVWCPINPRNAAAETAELLALFDCRVLLHQESFAAPAKELDLDVRVQFGAEFDAWLAAAADDPPIDADPTRIVDLRCPSRDDTSL